MMSTEFEEAVGNFLDRTEYDQAANALFEITRAAFQAGWLAAGGQPPVPQKLFQLVRPGETPPQDGEEERDEQQEKQAP